jgi:ATP-binding cassette subfamily B protein
VLAFWISTKISTHFVAGKVMVERESFWSGWKERVAALRNLPPVLKIVWQSGPTVVGLGLAFRVVGSLLPVALLAITKLIIDDIVHIVTTG